MDQNLYKLIRKSSFVSQSGSKFVQTYPNYHLFLKMDQNLCKLVQTIICFTKWIKICAHLCKLSSVSQNVKVVIKMPQTLSN